MKVDYKNKTITLTEDELSNITFNMCMGLCHLSDIMQESTGEQFEKCYRLHDECSKMLKELQYHASKMIESE